MDFDFDFDFDFEEKESVINPVAKELERLLAPAYYPYGFKDFSNKFLKKKNKAGKVDLWGLNQHQVKFFEKLCYVYNKYGDIFVVIIKCRQDGISTGLSEFGIYHKHVWGQDQYYLTNDTSNAQILFEKYYDVAYSNLDVVLKEEERFIKTGSYIKFKKNNIFFKTTENGKGYRTSPTRGKTYGFLGDDEAGHRFQGEDTTGLAMGQSRTHIISGTPTSGSYLESVYLSLKAKNELDRVLFLSWTDFDEYYIEPEKDFKPKPESLSYLKKFDLLNLPYGKIKWFEWQIDKYVFEKHFNPYQKFSQEHPSTIECGFELTADNCFCDPILIQNAFSNTTATRANPITIGLDVGGGGDKTIACFRSANYAEFIELAHNSTAYDHYETKTIQLINILRNNPSLQIEKINVDSSGQMGIDFVHKMKILFSKYGIYIPVNGFFFSEKVPVKANVFEERKLGIKEFMYFELRRWLQKGDVKLDASEVLKKELLATKITTKNGEEFLLTKEEIKKKLGHSPDYADALALTFAPKKDFTIFFQTFNALEGVK